MTQTTETRIEAEEWSIAEQMTDGAMCEWCGVCFEEHGYPVLCEDCWNIATEEEREGHHQNSKEQP